PGPRFSVAAVADVLDATVPERPGLGAPSRDRHTPAEARAYGVTLLDASTGRRYEARGVRIRLGRGRECEVRPVGSSDTIVSRIHAELTVGSTSGLVVRDAGSTNGTFVNNEPVTDAVPVRLGDRIMLGKGGPVLIVEGLGTAPQLAAAPRRSHVGPRTLRAMIGEAVAQAKRVRDDQRAAERRAPSPAMIDSLRRAVTAAEQHTQSLDAKLRAIRASDFATIAQQSQGAVGLVTVSFGHDYYSGTGFVIAADGYLLTNWHVVADSQHARPDTIWVTMADQAQARLADV